MTPGVEGIHETDQTTPQPSQPISEQTHMGTADGVVQGNLPTTPNIHQQPLERSNVTGGRRMNDMGTNTSKVVVEPTRSGLRTSSMETAQTSIPIVDVLLPSSHRDHVTIPHINLSISGYEPDSLRTSGMRSPSMQAQEVSTIPQLDGPRSLPMRDHTRGRVDGFSSQVEQDSSQGGTYMQRAFTTRRREHPGGDSDSDGYRRLHQDQRPPGRRRYPNGGGRPPDRGGYPGGGLPNGGGSPVGGYPNRSGRPPG